MLKLRKPIYELLQASKKWHGKLQYVLHVLGCLQSTSDPSLFIIDVKAGNKCFILVYVDDIILAAATLRQFRDVAASLRAKL